MAAGVRDSAGAVEGLSTREREVAQVAATGASTRSIAESLYISVRTVESHLSSIYLKLGVSSRPELVARLLRAGVSPPDRASRARPSAEPFGTASTRLTVPPVFVGRREESAVIANALNRARSGHQQMVLVGGEAGIGKSALVATAAAAAVAEGAILLAGRCEEDVTTPFGPLAEALRPYLLASADPLEDVTGPLGGALGAILPELAGRLPPVHNPLAPSVAPRVLVDTIERTLSGASREQVVVLAFEDLHWADRGTVSLLRRLVNGGTGRRLLVLATFRDTELTRSHPLPGLLADLWREESIERLHLGGLSEREAADLARQLSRGPMLEDAVLQIHKRTAGNPFFITHLLGHPERDEPESSHVAGPLRDVVLSMVRRDGEALVPSLQIAAIAGSEFDLAVIEAAAQSSGSVPAASILQHFEDAVRAGLLIEAPGERGVFRFVHDLVREALVASLGEARAARLHAAVGAALVAINGELDGPHAAVAAHLAASHLRQDRLRAGVFTLRAVKDATLRLSPDDAVQLAARGLLALPVGVEAEPVRLELLVAMTKLQAVRQDAGAHRRAVLEAVEVARRLGSPSALALAVDSFRLLPRMGTVDTEMLALGDDAAAALPPGPSALRSRLVSYSAYQRALGGVGFAAADQAGMAVAEARAVGDADALADALFASAACLIGRCEVQPLLLVTEELIGLADRVTESLGPIEGRWFLGAAHLASADRQAFEADRRELRRDAEQMSSQVERSMVSMWDAMVALLDGDLDAADGLTAQFLVEAGDDPNFLLGWFAQTCVLRAEQGRSLEMIPVAEQVLADHGDLAAVRAVAAHLMYAGGDLEGARTAVNPLVETRFERVPDDWLLPATLGMLVPVVAGAVIDEVQRMTACTALYERLSPYRTHALVMGFGTVVTGAADRYLGVLAGALGDRQAAEGHFRRAGDLEHKLGAPLLAQHTSLDRASFLLAGGTPSEAALGLELIAQASHEAEARGWIGAHRRAEQLGYS